MLNENQNLDDAERAVSTELEVTSNDTPALSPSKDDFSTIAGAVAQLENMKALASVYIKGGLCPIKTESDFVICVITGNQLGLPFVTSINNIFPINGKPAMSVHLIRALLLQKGVVFKKIMDITPIHQYFLTTVVDGNQVAMTDGGGKPILGGEAPYDTIDKSLYMVNPKPSDKITEYEFSRLLKQADGSYKELTTKSRFSILDSVKAGLDDKENWKKYPSAMLDARAFMKGAREVASDIIFGMYSVDELADAYDVPYTMSENGEQTVIDAEIVR